MVAPSNSFRRWLLILQCARHIVVAEIYGLDQKGRVLSEVSTRRGEIELEKGFENSFEFDCFSNFDFLDVTALNLPIKSFTKQIQTV